MKRYNITVNGKAYDVAVEEVNGSAPVAAPVAPVAAAPAPVVAAAPAAPTGGTAITAPMTGTIMGVKVNVGDSVSKGQVVAVLEAMKMENDIVAPADGKISAIVVKQGDSVETDQTIITMA